MMFGARACVSRLLHVVCIKGTSSSPLVFPFFEMLYSCVIVNK